MDNYRYKCEYCGKEYIPKRRKIQRFCSNSCRTRNWQLINKTALNISPSLNIEKLNTKDQPTEKMSWSGIGNATVGTLASTAIVGLAKEVFVPNQKKPATKEDIQELQKVVNRRYYKIHNMNLGPNGSLPYFDKFKGIVVYLTNDI